MLKTLGKFIFMIELGFKYITIFKQTFFHPFITLKPAYRTLSQERQNYSNKVLNYLNVEVNIHGKLPEENHVLYAINHRSLLDIIVMEHVFAKSSKNGAWIAKQELFDNKIYGKFFEYSGCISVDLDNKRGLLSFFKSIKKTLAKVNDMNIYIFPEGERFDGKGITEFQSGAAKIAKANKLKIVPIFLCCEMEKVFQNAPYKKPHTVEVFIGDFVDNATLEEDYTKFYNDAKGTL